MVDNMNKDDGGSAFPNAPLYGLQEEDGIYELLVDEQSSGMTLRDYFAAQALTGAQIWDAVINGKNAQFTATEKLAEVAYEIADAMLKAREQ